MEDMLAEAYPKFLLRFGLRRFKASEASDALRVAISRDGRRIEIVNKWPDKMTAKMGPRTSTEEKMRVGMMK